MKLGKQISLNFIATKLGISFSICVSRYVLNQVKGKDTHSYHPYMCWGKFSHFKDAMKEIVQIYRQMFHAGRKHTQSELS